MSIASVDWLLFDYWMLRLGIVLALSMAVAVIIERVMIGYGALRTRRLEKRYRPILQRALDGDASAVTDLIGSPTRHRIDLFEFLILPLIDERNPERVARTRSILLSLSIVDTADRYLRSRRWWRRAIALRALGLAQVRQRTAQIVAALDDVNAHVRAAALDALQDLRDPASLQAIVVRLHDASLHIGRRAAALAAFGPECEPFLLDLARVDPAQRARYARALRICGTRACRPALLDWTRDPRPNVQAVTFETLAHLGLDNSSAARAISALEHDDADVRAMAAFALRGWTGAGDAVPRLAAHLDDVWVVAIRAAQSLRSIQPHGIAALHTAQARTGVPGELARQMLWEERQRR